MKPLSPKVYWLTGLSGAGKTTISRITGEKLKAEGHPIFLLDGDRLRTGLNRDLGFSPADRKENIRRVAEVAKLFRDEGFIVLVAVISPLTELREMARATIGEENFREVFVDCPLDVCEERDVKGLYKKARAGEIPEFTGISAPFEVPSNPHLRLLTGKEAENETADNLYRFIVLNSALS